MGEIDNLSGRELRDAVHLARRIYVHLESRDYTFYEDLNVALAFLLDTGEDFEIKWDAAKKRYKVELGSGFLHIGTAPGTVEDSRFCGGTRTGLADAALKAWLMWKDEQEQAAGGGDGVVE